MKIFKLILTFVFGAIMIFAGLKHFQSPEIYFSFIPDFLPVQLVNYLVGILEFACGLGVFIPSFRGWTTLGILVLMLLFLPLHIVDIFKQKPSIGSHQVALIRLPIQFVLILWAWFISRK